MTSLEIICKSRSSSNGHPSKGWVAECWACIPLYSQKSKKNYNSINKEAGHHFGKDFWKSNSSLLWDFTQALTFHYEFWLNTGVTFYWESRVPIQRTSGCMSKQMHKTTQLMEHRLFAHHCRLYFITNAPPNSPLAGLLWVGGGGGRKISYLSWLQG